MRFSMLVALALGAASLCTAHAAAIEHADGQPVHRCIGEHGEITFSGFPCAGSRALPTPEKSSNPDTLAIGPTSTTMITCPATLDALRDAIAAAFARRDANVIAGLVRWDGVGGSAARERMRDLATMIVSPLLGIDIESDAPVDSLEDSDAAPSRGASDDDRDDARNSDRDANRVSSEPRDGAEPRDDDEAAAASHRRHSSRPVPGTVNIRAVNIRTDGEPGARDNAFRAVPAGGCYWLDW